MNVDFEGAMTRNQMNKISQVNTTNAVYVHTPVETAVTTGDKVAVLVLFDSWNLVFYLNTEAVQVSCDAIQVESHNNVPIPTWIKDLCSSDQCVGEHSQSSLILCVGKNKNTQKRVVFCLKLKNQCDHASLTEILNPIVDHIKTCYPEQANSPAWAVLWNHLVRNTTNGIYGGLPKHLLNLLHNDEGAVKEELTRDLHDHFSKKFELQFDNHWDRFLLGSSIKDLACKDLGFTSFDRMTNNRKICIEIIQQGDCLPGMPLFVKCIDTALLSTISVL